MGVAIGSKAWIFDINYRVYPEDRRGGPIWLKHWCETEVVGETSRSWILKRWDQKVPKKGEHYNVCFSWEEVEQRAWVHDNAYKVADCVGRLGDYEKLRAVADLIGYESR